MQLGVWSIFAYLNSDPLKVSSKFILRHVCFVCQDSSLPLVCDLLGVTVDQMNNVLEHKTFEELPFIMKDPHFLVLNVHLKRFWNQKDMSQLLSIS